MNNIYKCCSGNGWGEAGWAAVLAGTMGCLTLASVEGVEGLMAGGLETVELLESYLIDWEFGSFTEWSGKDAGFAIALLPYLERSASRLTRLNIRCVRPLWPRHCFPFPI